ncbi:MAG: lipopolysaccharide transport periplasmic protein LptA [Candidatus Nitrotoga sp.]
MIVTAPLLMLALTLLSTTSHAERTDREQPMRLEADQLSIDDANKISVFTGDVKLTQGTLVIRADKIVVTQIEDNFKRGVATGQPASFRQKRDGLDEYAEGHAERVEYDSKHTTVNLFGQARIKRGRDEISGDHIIYNSETGVFQATGDGAPNKPGKGRVHAVIQPENKSTPNKPIPDKSTPAKEGR